MYSYVIEFLNNLDENNRNKEKIKLVKNLRPESKIRGRKAKDKIDGST